MLNQKELFYLVKRYILHNIIFQSSLLEVNQANISMVEI